MTQDELTILVQETILEDSCQEYLLSDPLMTARKIIQKLRSLNLLVPEGWQAVPKEPTEEMFDAGSDHNPTRWTAHTDRGFPREVAHMVFSSMLVAAPKPGDQT